jgi:hypothetical protein
MEASCINLYELNLEHNESFFFKLKTVHNFKNRKKSNLKNKYGAPASTRLGFVLQLVRKANMSENFRFCSPTGNNQESI